MKDYDIYVERWLGRQCELNVVLWEEDPQRVSFFLILRQTDYTITYHDLEDHLSDCNRLNPFGYSDSLRMANHWMSCTHLVAFRKTIDTKKVVSLNHFRTWSLNMFKLFEIFQIC